MPQPASISVSPLNHFRPGHLVQVIAERPVAGHRSRFAEHDLADVNRQVWMRVDVVRELDRV